MSNVTRFLETAKEKHNFRHSCTMRLRQRELLYCALFTDILEFQRIALNTAMGIEKRLLIISNAFWNAPQKHIKNHSAHHNHVASEKGKMKSNRLDASIENNNTRHKVTQWKIL